jgi:peptide/nickel transport system ATP-binding protein
MASRELLRVEGVDASYLANDGLSIHAVDHVSLTVNEGEVLGIAGESGCGKSTLAAVLALNARPPLVVRAGSMLFDGQVISLADQHHLPAEWRGKLMSLLPQGAMNALNPTARVRDLAIDVIRAHEPDVSRPDAIARAASRLEQLSLPPRALDSYPHQLSGGMRQRVVAAISTLLNPRVLIADEPTSALDVSSQRALVRMLLELLERDLVSGIVFISHDLPLLSNVADRIAIMYAGQIVETAPVASIVGASRHPYTQALIGSALVPEPHVRRRRVEGIGGAPPDLRYPPPGCRFHPRCPRRMDICAREQPANISVDGTTLACWWAEEEFQNAPLEVAHA